jgi:UDP-glucose 4-epimerase
VKKGKSVLITGGCGFIGANLVTMLLEKDYILKVLDNLSVGRKENIPCDVDLVIGDVRDENLVSESVDGIDVIVHLAAHTNVIESVKNPQLDFDINVKGTFNLLQKSVETGHINKFIFASSNAAVGEQEPPITESAIPSPLSPYGASKLACEAFCSAFSGSYELQTISLRFANAYGPLSNHKESVVAKFFRKSLKNEAISIYGDGNQTRDFIYVDDICHAILLAIENDSATGVFQIGTGTETKIINLAKQIIKTTNSDSDIVFVPPRRGEIIRNYSCIDKAIDVLEFEPEIDLDTGLAKTCEWFRRKLDADYTDIADYRR